VTSTITDTLPDAPTHAERQQEARALSEQGRFAEALAVLAPLVGTHARADDAGRAETLHLAALCALGTGRTGEAQALWQRCIEAKPALVEAWHGLAAMLTALGQWPAAETLWRRLLAVAPTHADAHSNLGIVLHRLGRAQEAELAYRMALAHQPEHVDAHYNLGIVLHEAGRRDEAEAAYHAALAGNPRHARAHNNLGTLLRELGRLEAAEEAWRQALLAEPQYPEALNNYGALLKSLGRLMEAELACRLAIQIRPDYVEALNNLGCVLTELGRQTEAELLYRQALALRPDHIEAHYNLGVALYQLERYPEAETAWRTTLRLAPAHAQALNNLGCMLGMLGRLAEARAALERALECDARLAQAHFNLGGVLKELGALDEAQTAYRRAIALAPDYGDAVFRLATLLITMGRYEEGWRLYERRYENTGFVHFASRGMLSCTHWQGEPLAGKSLLLWQEDGLGDMLQFARYARLVKAQGAAQVAFGCVEALHRVLAGVEGIDAVLTHAEATARAAQFDYWASPLSLPLRLATTLDTTPPPARFEPDPALVDKWAARLATLGAGPRIGLVWKGNPQHHNDRHRSIPSLAVLAPLWSVPGLKFVSLQKGAGEDEANEAQRAGADTGAGTGAKQPLLHLGAEIADFVDTAAIVSQLDLLICVDTSTAHLAASLGTPCWVMLPGRDVDWRWLHEREDSPWYPRTMRLFRQSADETWSAPIERVRQACVERFGR
jgi:tetratricopeptide (TPR) repeat protein